MVVQQRIYNIDDLWQLVCESNDDARYELIEGEIVTMAPPGGEHSTVTGEVFHYFRLFDPQRKLGVPTVDAGYYPPGKRDILLAPEAAFTGTERAPKPFPRAWVPVMPDIAVKLKSPTNTFAELRRKAAIYLQHGTQLVWIIIPEQRSAEVHRLCEDGGIEREIIGQDGNLSGEDILPGFSLNIALLFT